MKERNIMNRDEMKEMLAENICVCTFTKVNGDERVMVCTLKESIVPATTGSGSSSPVNEEVLPVWDVQAEDWRSFRIDRVKKFRLLKDAING